MVEGESGSTMLVFTKKKKSALPNQPDMNQKRRLIQRGEARVELHREHLNWTRIISSPKIAFQQDRIVLDFHIHQTSLGLPESLLHFMTDY